MRSCVKVSKRLKNHSPIIVEQFAADLKKEAETINNSKN